MVRIFAHRGFSGMYPENTMLSFSKAVEAKADGIELDIHFSKDGEIMIQHDEAMRRTSGLDGFIFDYTRSELEKINAGSLFDNRFGFTPIPSFEEYLDFVKDKKIVTNIELKTAPVYYDGIEERAVDMVYRTGLEDSVIFSSFNWLSIVRLHKIAPELPVALLIDQRLYNMGPLFKREGISYFHPSYGTIDMDSVKDMRSNGVGINVWTVNDEADIITALNLKVDGIITNYPDRARRLAKDI